MRVRGYRFVLCESILTFNVRSLLSPHNRTFHFLGGHPIPDAILLTSRNTALSGLSIDKALHQISAPQ
jgi:hypothetical protein